MFALITASAATAHAQNLLANGTFDTSIAGWRNDFGPDIAWSSQDAHGSSSSGSMRIKSFNWPTINASQTIAVTPGVTYTLSGSLYAQMQLAPDSYVFILGAWVDGAGREVSPNAQLRVDSTRQSQWERRSATGTAPAGAVSMRVLADVIAYAPTQADFALFDDLSVTVLTPAPTITFSANPMMIGANETSALLWTSSNASSVTIDHGIGARPLSGSISVTPGQTTTYLLTATGAGGTRIATATVTVVPAPTIVFTATPPSTLPGGSVKLEWQVFDATLVTLDPDLGAQPFVGSLMVTPKTSTVYTLTATGIGGTRAMPLTVVVGGRRRAARH